MNYFHYLYYLILSSNAHNSRPHSKLTTFLRLTTFEVITRLDINYVNIKSIKFAFEKEKMIQSLNARDFELKVTRN